MPIYRGCDYSKVIRFQSRSDGQPIDISTWQFEATLRDGDGGELLEMSTAGEHFAVTDGPNGEMTWTLTTDQSDELTAGPVSFALYRTDTGRKRLLRASDQVREQD